MKLKTAIEYWDYLFTIPITERAHFIRYENYIVFLKQLLQLWMFIPCDKEGKPLENPKDYENLLMHITLDMWDGTAEVKNKVLEYQQACDRKIFTGFELYQDTYFNGYNCVIRSTDMVIINIENKTIEDIAPLQVDLVEKVCKQFKY